MKVLLPILFVFCLCFAGISSADLFVYEGFQYSEVGDPLDAITTIDTDATGLTGLWVDNLNNTESFLKSGSLTFSNLSVNGNHIGYESNSNNDIWVRDFDPTAATGITTASTLYFSFLFEKLQSRFSADREGIALLNGALPQARWDGTNNPGAVDRHGFAIAATDNSNLRAIAYDGTTGTRVVGEEILPITVVNGGTNTSISNVEVNFIVGEISFNTGTNGADVFNLWNAADDGDLDASDLTLIDTIEADVDETTLTTLNLTRQVNVNWDEVRIGSTLADVLPTGGGGGPTVPQGDYNADDIVDLADYTLWRNNLGEPAGTLPNDDSGLVIGETQYNTWRSNYGAVTQLGAVTAAVPEPTSLVLTGLGGVVALLYRRK